MFASLRSRLWWSYVLVIGSALAVVGLVLLIYIVQNPSTYRVASARLTVVETLLRKNEAELISASPAVLQARLAQVDTTYGVRVVVFNNRRQLLADSRETTQGAIQMPLFPRLRFSSVLRDKNGQPWLYLIQHLTGGRWLMVAVPRPAVPLLAALSDELVLPILVAGIVALIISLLVAFWLARWIGGPLQRVAVASRTMPSAQVAPVEPHGPREVQDLTRAFNEMNARVAATQNSQREFVANVSHELKTPLTSVQGFAQALLDGTAGTPESRQQAARIIYDEAGRMHRMVLDLLELARLDAGTLDLQFAAVDLPSLLASVAEKFGPQAQTAGVTIQVESGPLPTITGDGDRLAQVFTNLVDNSLKNTSPGGRIILNAVQSDAEVQVEVTDTGRGIPTESLPHIFERFYQADPSRPGGEKHGSGLGLAIVKEIVEAHGGKISVRSTQRPGWNETGVSGTTFTVTLPLATAGKSPIVAKRVKN